MSGAAVRWPRATAAVPVLKVTLERQGDFSAREAWTGWHPRGQPHTPSGPAVSGPGRPGSWAVTAVIHGVGRASPWRRGRRDCPEESPGQPAASRLQLLVASERKASVTAGRRRPGPFSAVLRTQCPFDGLNVCYVTLTRQINSAGIIVRRAGSEDGQGEEPTGGGGTKPWLR